MSGPEPETHPEPPPAAPHSAGVNAVDWLYTNQVPLFLLLALLVMVMTGYGW